MLGEGTDMKKILLIAMVFAFAALVAGTVAAQDAPLADYARQARKDKAGRPAAKKVYTDDDLPHVDKLSTIPAESPSASGETAPSETEQPATPAEEGKTDTAAKKPATATEADKPAPKKEDSAQAKQKDWEGWKAKIQTQKDAITLAEKELNILQREFKLRQAAFYGDAAQRMQNAAAWDREDNNYRDQIDKKQKEVDSAKAKLEKMQDEARRAGVPGSFRE